jgi:hypothetical protein
MGGAELDLMLANSALASVNRAGMRELREENHDMATTKP